MFVIRAWGTLLLRFKVSASSDANRLVRQIHELATNEWRYVAISRILAIKEELPRM